MKFVNINAVVLLLMVAGSPILPTAVGLQCYTCARGKGGKSCEELDRLTLEADKKLRFGTTCSPTAKGCAYVKLHIDDELLKLSTEGLQCYEPNERTVKAVKMNDCSEEVQGHSLQKLCVCDTGDFCMAGGSASMQMGGAGKVVFMGVVVLIAIINVILITPKL